MIPYDDCVRYHGLIFDCDGTLTDSMPLHYRSWREALRTVAIDFTEQKFYALAGMPGEKVVSAIAAEFDRTLDEKTVKEVLNQKDQRFMERIDELKPFEMTLKIARRFHGEKPLAVASGGSREDVHVQLDHLGIGSLFEAVVTAEDTQKHKPHPDVFLEAADRLKISPQHCLVFEDGDLGIQAAKRAGMDCVDVRSFRGSP